MRMWLCNPRILCTKHLLGEHVELHMFVGCINKGFQIDGYLRNNLLQVDKILRRHNELKKEMINRGMNHKSDIVITKKLIEYYGDYDHEIDTQCALNELLRRCSKCKDRYDKLAGEHS